MTKERIVEKEKSGRDKGSLFSRLVRSCIGAEGTITQNEVKKLKKLKKDSLNMQDIINNPLYGRLGSRYQEPSPYGCLKCGRSQQLRLHEQIDVGT